jgi:hypothetical protein
MRKNMFSAQDEAKPDIDDTIRGLNLASVKHTTVQAAVIA